MRRFAMAVIGLTLAFFLSGCSFVAGELADDEVPEIPAALLASNIGVTEASAAKTLSGFTHYLSVGVHLDHDELTDRELAEILQIIVDKNDLPIDVIRLLIFNSTNDSMDLTKDLESRMERLVPGVVRSSSYGVSITLDGAREVVDAVGSLSL